MTGQELADKIAELVEGEDGRDIFDTLVGTAFGLFETAPFDVQREMAKRVLGAVEMNFGLKICVKRVESRDAQVEAELLR